MLVPLPRSVLPGLFEPVENHLDLAWVTNQANRSVVLAESCVAFVVIPLNRYLLYLEWTILLPLSMLLLFQLKPIHDFVKTIERSA